MLFTGENLWYHHVTGWPTIFPKYDWQIVRILVTKVAYYVRISLANHLDKIDKNIRVSLAKCHNIIAKSIRISLEVSGYQWQNCLNIIDVSRYHWQRVRISLTKYQDIIDKVSGYHWQLEYHWQSQDIDRQDIIDKESAYHWWSVRISLTKLVKKVMYLY